MSYQQPTRKFKIGDIVIWSDDYNYEIYIIKNITDYNYHIQLLKSNWCVSYDIIPIPIRQLEQSCRLISNLEKMKYL